MSKIICDVCGTSYPETAEQCPICGCVCSDNGQGILQDTENSETRSGYTYVKGGRFSKANVKKRNRASQSSLAEPEYKNEIEEDEKPATNKGLVITALVLLLAIVAVIIYITVRFLTPTDVKPEKEAEQISTETQVQVEKKEIPCTAIKPVKKEIELESLGAGFLLDYSIEPVDSTDEVTVESSDESVFVVEKKDGNTCLIKAVAPGEDAYLIIKCGDIRVECKVVCDFEMPPEETTEPTEEPTEETTVPEYTEEDIIFNTIYKSEAGVPEVTLRYAGEVWRCYKGNIPLEEITWKSDNEAVATVDKGVVTAVGSGDTLIHAIWGEFDVVCKVRSLGSSQDSGLSGSGGNIGEG